MRCSLTLVRMAITIKTTETGENEEKSKASSCPAFCFPCDSALGAPRTWQVSNTPFFLELFREKCVPWGPLAAAP